MRPASAVPDQQERQGGVFGFVRTSGGVETTYGPTTPPDRVLDTATLLAGDHLEAFFTIAAGCEPLKVSLVVYCAEAGWDLTQQTVHDFDSGFFGPNGVHTLDIDIPPLTTCRYFQVDFVRGSVIWQFSPPNGTYAAQGRLLDFYRGSPA